MKKKALFLSVLVATFAVTLVVRAKLRSSEREALASTRDLLPEVVAPGRVEGRDRVLNLAFEQTGRIVLLPVKEGQHVTKGELLAALDDRVAKARLAHAEAGLMGARARRDLAFKGSRTEELRAAEAELDAATAQARNQSLERGRAERLVRDNAIPVAENDRLVAAADSSSAQVTAAEARLSMLREGTRGELKRAAIADLAAAEAAVEEARAVLSQTRLVAPCDATVVRRFMSEGELVTLMPPSTVISLADMSRFRLRAEVDEEDISSVAVGQPGYTVAAAFSGQRFSGHVIEKMRDIGRKGVRNEDDPRARVDTRVLEVLFEFDGNVSLPIGLRMDLHLSTSKLAER
jgi:multidrug resistance efflux pump